MVKSWLVQDQTVLGKDYSNLLIVDSLLKPVWFINATYCYDNDALAIVQKPNGICLSGFIPWSIKGKPYGHREIKEQEQLNLHTYPYLIGLIDAVNDWLPEIEHIKCTRHIYANFKKKYSRLQYQRLFWVAASCTLEHQFQQIMDQIKLLDANAYDYLIQRNPNSWSRAFFEIDRRCVAFEIGISEIAMNKIAFSLEDRITPSIRKRLELLKEKQREWIVFLSGFQELEVRKGDQSYGVNLQYKKRTNDVPPLPLIIRKMPDKPQKARIKAPGETSGSQVSSVGRTMKCKNCWQKGHNKASCKADPQPKPEVEKNPPGRKKHVFIRQCASRGDGRSGRVNGNDGSVVEGGWLRRAGGRGKRGGGRAGIGGGMGGSSSFGILTAEECYLFCNPFSSTAMGDANPICTFGDYSKPSDEGYKNNIELPVGNNVVPLRFDTIRLVQNGCSFHGLWSEDPNQHLKDFLKLMDSLNLDGENKERTRMRLFQFSLRD
ncbi:hypothetical protein Tco_1220739 [Tanacetum coccineum]